MHQLLKSLVTYAPSSGRMEEEELTRGSDDFRNTDLRILQTITAAIYCSKPPNRVTLSARCQWMVFFCLDRLLNPFCHCQCQWTVKSENKPLKFWATSPNTRVDFLLLESAKPEPSRQARRSWFLIFFTCWRMQSGEAETPPQQRRHYSSRWMLHRVRLQSHNSAYYPHYRSTTYNLEPLHACNARSSPNLNL